MGKAEETASFAMLPKALNGGIAGFLGVSVIFPLDLVKTRLQNQQFESKGEKMYSSMIDCLKKTYKSEGFLGMYKGSAVNILLVTPEKSIKLAANDFFRYYLKSPERSLSLTKQVTAASLAGTIQSIITTPMELLKIQMQDAGRVAAASKAVTNSTKEITSSQTTRKLLTNHGVLGLYKGSTATILRNVSFSAIYFPLFAAFNDLGPKKSDGSGDSVFWCSFLAGCVAGSLSAIANNPVDLVKTRLQSLHKADGERYYSGILDCIMKTYKYEGAMAFFKGAGVRVMVVAPLYGIAQTVYYLGAAEYLLGVQKPKYH